MQRDQLRATRVWLQKQFKTSGIQLDPAALEQLVEVVQDVPDPEEYVHALIEEVEAGRARARAPGSPAGRAAGGGRRRQLRPRPCTHTLTLASSLPPQSATPAC